MSDNVASIRHSNLAKQYAWIEDQRGDADPFSGGLDSLYQQVGAQFEKAGKRKEAFDHLVEQEAAPRTQNNLYDRYVQAVDSAQQDLADLQQALAYADIHLRQQTQFTNKIEQVSAVCDEIAAVFQCSPTILPIIWDGYASFGIVHGQIYAIHIPRHNELDGNIPLLAHELGHASFDQVPIDQRRSFRAAVEQISSEFAGDRGTRFNIAWRMWFPELYCDACGFFVFGPAYLASLVSELTERTPFLLPRKGEETQITHPPSALRFEFVEHLAETYLTDEVYAKTTPFRRQYRSHLEKLEGEKPGYYDAWAEHDLLERVEAIATSQLECDMADLCERVVAGPVGDERDPHRHRVAAYQFWFGE